MSSAYVFYSSIKRIKTKSKEINRLKSVLPLPNYHVFIAFADGHWVLHDTLKDQLIKEGVVQGDASKYLVLIKSPKALDKNTIIYTNCSMFKLQALNPYTGEHDQNWQQDAPTLEGLPEADRTNESKVDKAYTGFEIEVLRKSRVVGVQERKENTQGFFDYFITVYAEGQKERLLQVTHNAQGKQMKFKNGNDEDTFIFYSTTQYESFQICVLNINEREKGLQNVTINTRMDCTLFNLYPWGDKTIALFGNPDANGTPLQVIHKLGTDKVDIITMDCHYQNKKTILNNVLAADPVKKRVLLKESSNPPTVAVWNSAYNRVEFAREQPNTRDCAGSLDGTYFVEFDRNLRGEKEETKITVNRLVSKKMFILHFMKHAKLPSGRTFMEFHGSSDILKDVAGMI